MPLQLRNRTPVTNTELTSSSAASSATLEHTESATERPTLRERPDSRRPKRGLRALSEEGAKSPNMAFDETPSLPKRKRRRVEQSKDLVDNKSLWISVLECLNMLYQAQDKHQRITTTIIDKIGTQNDKLISALRELLDSQKCRLFEGFKDTDNRTHTLVGDLVEDLQAQQRYLFEKGIKDTEQLIRTLVADLVDDQSISRKLNLLDIAFLSCRLKGRSPFFIRCWGVSHRAAMTSGLSGSDPDLSGDDDGCSSEDEQGRSSTSKHSRWDDIDK
ncbi:uncharacterized protein PAC_14774 [Phialocephala subalpina]|uniref:Uncharacterized protein n=1 Tax=Phialocephala subalpina TaxID=576137 RepID=A0A1L7XIM6_9HELO|nr:uncharacterized protein PAC_14774 [Phialocephala subalpina]